MADRAIVDRAVAAAPKDYVVGANVTLALKAVGATINGGGAGGPYLPAVQLIDPAGDVMWTAVPPTPIAAGGSAVVSWFPGGGVEEAASSSAGGGTVSSITSPLGTLSVANPTGPSTNIDMPTTGVAAGSYGDSSHSAQLTVDAEGRITAAASVGIAGGSGTIGFEIGYDQITASVVIASTSEATPTTIITCASHTFDGAPVLLTVYFPFVQTGSSGLTNVTPSLWEGVTEITRLGFISYGPGAALLAAQTYEYRFTPTVGAHTYVIKAHAGTLTGSPTMGAGSGSGANYPPAFARFTKV